MLNAGCSPWPSFTEEESEAVRNILLSNKVNYWTGEEGRNFEREFASFVGTEYAIAVSNGSVALDLALRAIGISPGDEVIVTPRSFIASVSCVVNLGATPVFADVDLESQNITSETIRPVITPYTKAIVCVHLAGWPCDMRPIMELANSYGLYVVEDCAQAHGAMYKGASVGSLGHIGAWSFCQDKIMSTGGEGGMITTMDEGLWKRMWSFKDHGKSWDAVYGRDHPPGFRWMHESFGTNYRLTEMQSAIGRIQLKRLPGWVRQRNRNAEMLKSALSQFDYLRVPTPDTDLIHAYYKFYAFLDPEKLPAGRSRDKIIDLLNSQGVPCMQGSCSEIYLEKAFDVLWEDAPTLPNAKKLGETSLMFLVHPTLNESELKTWCSRILSVFESLSELSPSKAGSRA